jgi:hypothetical protein
MNRLNKTETNLIIESLKAEHRALREMMNDLEHRGLHQGNQNVAIQTRMGEISDLVKRLDGKALAILNIAE